MKLAKIICFFIVFTFNQCCQGFDNIENNLQLLVVTTNNWDESKGYLRLFEKATQEDPWVIVTDPIPIVIGKAGMAWGIGLKDFNVGTSPQKSEGDLKTPAGIFSVGPIFGFYPRSQMTDLKMDYLELNEFTEAIDDPLSEHYNCIFDSTIVAADWKSSEKMFFVPLYEIGFVVNHNFPNTQPGKGSAIFFHIWRNSDLYTAGCTAMSYENLMRIVRWLDSSKNPTLIQLPYPVYFNIQAALQLPWLDHDMLHN